MSAPAMSGYTVTQKWKWTNPWASNVVEQVEISKNGNYIIGIHGNSYNATLFTKNSNSTVWVYESNWNLNDAAISYDGKYIVICDTRNVYFLNNSAEKPKNVLWTFPSNQPPYVSSWVDISLDGTYISVVNNTAVFLLDNNGQVEWSYDTGIGNFLMGVAISGDGNYIITADSNKFYLFNTTDYQGRPMWTYDININAVSLVISDDGNYAVVANSMREVYLFNTTDHQGIPMWNKTMTSGVEDLAISSDGKYIVICENAGIHYLNNSFFIGDKPTMWTFVPIHDGMSVDITSDGKYVVGGTQLFATAYLINNTITNPKFAEWNFPSDVKSISISGFGDYFAIGTQNRELIFFHHARPLPIYYDDDGDDDDDDEKKEEIPFGNYYLVFSVIAIISLIIIIKRKGISTKI